MTKRLQVLLHDEDYRFLQQSARDALHVAVMRTAGISRIVSLDRGFDLCPEIDRLY